MNTLSPVLPHATRSVRPLSSRTPAAPPASGPVDLCEPANAMEGAGMIARGLTAGAALGVAGAGAGVYFAARYTPQGLANAVAGIWSGDGSPFQKVAATAVASLLIPTVFPVICLVGSTLNGLEAGMSTAPCDGYVAAARDFAAKTIMADYNADVMTGGKP